MTHLHFPDGVLPGTWVLLSFIVCIFLLALAIYFVGKRSDHKRKMVHTAVISALMLIGMSIPLGIIPYHMNLTVLAGIILGSGFGFISVVIVNLFLALIGHGGITVIGLNSLIIGLEVLFADKLYTKLKNIGMVKGIAVTTLLTLVLSTTFMVSVVSTMNLEAEDALHIHNEHNAHEEAHDHPHEDEHHDEKTEDHLCHSDAHFSDTVEVSAAAFQNNFFSFLSVVAPIAAPGIILESIVIAMIFRYLARVKPDIIDLN